MKTTHKRFVTLALCFAFLATTTLTSAGCSGKVQAENLMEDISAQNVQGKPVDAEFIASVADFYFELFRKTTAADENSLVSPLSVLLALAMTANGADTETLTQMETVLGRDVALSELNEYLFSYVSNLPSKDDCKVTIANSIWFRDDELVVEKPFLQTNANYYGAAAYKSAFDDQTLKDINNWVKKNTDGMIDKILDEIHVDAVMYLINALVFDAKWEKVYTKNDIYQGEFTAFDGSKGQADFMSSGEKFYLDDGQAVGFIKPYAGNKYSFVALLPNEGISIQEYVDSLSGDQFLEVINSAEQTPVNAHLPKFSYDYTVGMNDPLKEIGMPIAFSPAQADFTRLGRSSRGNIYIGDVLHKTFISVDELGTKAGAVTKVEMRAESAPLEVKTVKLNRPFVYAIIDNATSLPVFIGTVLDLNN